MNQIILHKKSNDSIYYDTIITAQDSLKIDFSSTHLIRPTKEPIEVKTPGKDWVDYTVIFVTTVGAIIAAYYTLKSIKKLYERDEQKQAQIDELANQTRELIRNNQLYEKRVRMLVKPRIWSNGGGYSASNNQIDVKINNRGELCFLDSFIQTDGDNISFNKWDKAIPIPKNGRIIITGFSIHKHPKDATFKLLLKYYDQENYKYESIVEWKGGKSEVIETKEL